MGAVASHSVEANAATYRPVDQPTLPDVPKVKLQVKVYTVLGEGHFSKVFKASIQVQDEKKETIVAMKKAKHDPKTEYREVQMLRGLHHLNIVRLLYFYDEEEEGVKTLIMLLEFMPTTVAEQEKEAKKYNMTIPIIEIKLWCLQLLRALEYMHGLKVCHRDIKPQNLLLDRDTALVKVGDFGSAKQLHPDGDPTYIVSRWYRAPELIYGNRKYSNQIDMWACGCVLGQLFTMKPLFPADRDDKHLILIMSRLGGPTEAQNKDLNPDNPPAPFDVRMESKPWTQLMPSSVPESGCSLLSGLLQWAPSDRLQASAALAMPFFDDVRHNKRLVLPNGKLVDKAIFE